MRRVLMDDAISIRSTVVTRGSTTSFSGGY